MRKFPLFIDISDKKILIVGGGVVAERRAQTLSKFGCKLTIVSPHFTEVLQEMKDVTLIKREYKKSDCENAFMVLATTNNSDVNEQVAKDAKLLGALANASHDKDLSDFYFPGIVTKGQNVVIGVTASGEDHKKAAQIRREIAQLIDGEN